MAVTSTLAVTLGLAVLPAAASGQGLGGTPPWGNTTVRSQTPTGSGSAPVWSGAWPVHPGRVAIEASVSSPSERGTDERLTEPRDPGDGYFFQMPTAHVVRYGDVQGHYISDLGWMGVRYGVARGVDVGVGVPYYFLGVSVDGRVSLVERPGFALAWWGYATVPFQSTAALATTNLGFTWAHAGMGWSTGPVVSVWGERAGFHAGLAVAQRTGLGGAWVMAHATVEIRVVTGVKLVAQGIAFAEVISESGTGDSSLVGNAQRRFLPYVLSGPRFYTRRFAADIGVLIPLDDHDPLATAHLPALPWVSLSHLF